MNTAQPHIFERFKQRICTVFEDCYPSMLTDSLRRSVQVELSKEQQHGDLATNIAMVMAKPLQLAPRAIAEKLLQTLPNLLPEIERADIAGPGFINLTLKPAVWQGVVQEVLQAKDTYGSSQIGKGKSVNIEYVSVNPTGPMHVGHVRGAVVGDTLAALWEKLGFAVVREYYFNDAGGQIDVLARSSFIRYRQALGEKNLEVPEGLYPGEYLIAVGESLKAQHGDQLLTLSEETWLPIVRQHAVKAMMALIKEDLDLLGVHHDVFTSEQSIHDRHLIEAGLKILETHDLMYHGVLERPKSKELEDWEPREQYLFKSTAFGDDVDRAIQKADGSWTYFAADIGYTYDKVNERQFNTLIYVLGADHAGYVKRLKSVVSALSQKQAESHVLLCQLVQLMRGKEVVKMSKRAGDFITAREVIEQVGKDSIRFMMLYRKHDMAIDFDLDLVVQQSKDNPVFYVQYAHARACSVMRAAEEAYQNADVARAVRDGKANMSLLTAPGELQLMKLLASWPLVVERAAFAYEPHRIVFFMHELASAIHSLWNVGHTQHDARFVVAGNLELTLARLSLVEAVKTVIASGLALCAIIPQEQMR